MGKLLFFALFLFFASFACAQNTDFTATAPAKVIVNACTIAESGVAVVNLADFPAGFSFSLEGRAAKFATVADHLVLDSGASGSVVLYFNVPCDALGSYELVTRIRSDLGREKVLRQVVYVPGNVSLFDFSSFSSFFSRHARYLLFFPLALLLLIIIVALVKMLVGKKPERVVKEVVRKEVDVREGVNLFVLAALLFVLALWLVSGLVIIRTVSPVFAGNITAANISGMNVTNITKANLTNASGFSVFKPLFQQVNLTTNLSLNVSLPRPRLGNVTFSFDAGFVNAPKNIVVKYFNRFKPYLPHVLAGLVVLVVLIVVINLFRKVRIRPHEELYRAVKVPKVEKRVVRKRKRNFSVPKNLLKGLGVLLLLAVVVFSLVRYGKSIPSVRKMTLPSALVRANVSGAAFSEAALNVKDFFATYAFYMAAGFIVLFIVVFVLSKKEK